METTNKEERLKVLLSNCISLFMDEVWDSYDSPELWKRQFCEEMGTTEDELTSFGISLDNDYDDEEDED